MTPQEKQLGVFLYVSAAVYAAGAIAFPAAGQLVFDFFNLVTPASLAPIPASSESFWVTLSSSMMATIATCCFLGAKDPVRRKDMCIPVMVSKATSSLVGVLFFLFASPRHLAYLGVASTDLPLCIATYVFWSRAKATPSAAAQIA